MSFQHFELLPELNDAIAAMGFVEPTPIQRQAVPAVLEGWDVLGSAQTGSGKTVAFTLPMLQRLIEWRKAEGPGGIRAMILTPTRELAAQVEQCVNDLSRGAVKTALIIGGEAYGGQLKALKGGAEVVVATPGRLLDHQGSGALSLKGVRFAVLDEADRMLDMGFIPDIRRIMGSLPAQRQTLMFSATMPPEIERLVREFMKDPFRCQVDRPTKPAASIRQAIYPVTEDQKLELLLAMTSKLDMKCAVVFTRTKQRAERVGKFLEARGLNAATLHSDLSQAQRTRTMDAFRDKKIRVLVATDLASRGLDVPHVTHVVNFDAPSHPEDYVHRIGRTGRAFSAGDAVMLMSFEDQKPMAAVEAYIGETIPRLALEGFPYRVQPRLVAYKPPLSANFRLRRVIPRGSGARFRR